MSQFKYSRAEIIELVNVAINNSNNSTDVADQVYNKGMDDGLEFVLNLLESKDGSGCGKSCTCSGS